MVMMMTMSVTMVMMPSQEFSSTCLAGLDIPLFEDRTGQISRSFQLLDSTTHRAVPTTLVIDDEGELMASFSNTFQVTSLPPASCLLPPASR